MNNADALVVRGTRCVLFIQVCLALATASLGAILHVGLVISFVNNVSLLYVYIMLENFKLDTLHYMHILIYSGVPRNLCNMQLTFAFLQWNV